MAQMCRASQGLRRALAAHCPVIILALVILTVTSDWIGAQQTGAASTWRSVDQALGRPGVLQEGDVMKYSFPRSDLQVTAAGVQLKPALALGSWLAFKRVRGGHTMVMGDLVLTEAEVGPVMRALQKGGVEQTALHNHVLDESPRVMYMHVSAHGNAVLIAQAVRAALAETGTPTGTPGVPAVASATDLDTAAIARTLGVAGKLNGVVYQVNIPRQEVIREGGNIVPASMGLATVINFQPTGGGRAAITGDFVMRASEVNNVIRALQQGGIGVSALHSHMLREEPRLFFMHFWANDDAGRLAVTLRAALEQTRSRITR